MRFVCIYYLSRLINLESIQTCWSLWLPCWAAIRRRCRRRREEIFDRELRRVPMPRSSIYWRSAANSQLRISSLICSDLLRRQWSRVFGASCISSVQLPSPNYLKNKRAMNKYTSAKKGRKFRDQFRTCGNDTWIIFWSNVAAAHALLGSHRATAVTHR